MAGRHTSSDRSHDDDHMARRKGGGGGGMSNAPKCDLRASLKHCRATDTGRRAPLHSAGASAVSLERGFRPATNPPPTSESHHRYPVPRKVGSMLVCAGLLHIAKKRLFASLPLPCYRRVLLLEGFD